MSVESDNKSFIETVLTAVSPVGGPSLTPDFSKYTYGLWVSFFENPNHSENGYTIPQPLVEDIVASRFAVTGKKFSILNYEGEAPKARFFLTEGFLGLDGYDYLKDFEITDRFISGSSPNIIMPDMDFAGKVYRRYEITGLEKSKATNNDILVVSGEDWENTSLSINSSNTDAVYTYIDAGHTGYRNEVNTRYKFLYDDSKNSITQDYSIFEIPYQIEGQSSLKYRISRASEPLGIYSYAQLTADGKAIIDYSNYKEEVSGVIDGQITYNFEPVTELSFSKDEFQNIIDTNSVKERRIKNDPSLTGFRISKSSDVFQFILLSTGDFEDIYKLDISIERFKTKDKPNISGYVMTSYNIGNGAVNITLSSGDNVYPRINEDGQPFGYDNLQDLIDVEQIQESEKYAQDTQIPDAGDEEDESVLAKTITNNFDALAKALDGNFGEDSDEKTQGEAWEVRNTIDQEDESLLTIANNEISPYRVALPNFPLPKKFITRDFYSNYINSGESYVVIPLASYGLNATFVSCGDQFGVLAYYINEDENPEAPEPVFRTVVNSTCDGYYIDASGFCKGDTAIYDNNKSYSNSLKIQNGLATQIPENGIISKANFIGQEPWSKAINYFYTKNYVASFNIYPSLPETGYRVLFSQALREVNKRIGGPTSDSSYDSFYYNGGSSPRVFVEREIYTKSYRKDESFELNQAILSGVYTPSDADLSNEEIEKLYCIHTYEPRTANSFIIDKQNYFYPVQDYSEEISFRKFLENSSAALSYSTGENYGTVSFVDTEIEVEKLFRVEYVTGNTFSYNDTSNFRVWSAPGSPSSNISIIDQNTKNYSYHLYGYNSASANLSFVKSNVISGEYTPTNPYSSLVVLKFIKQGLTDSVFQTETNTVDGKTTKSSIDVSILNSAGALLDPSKVTLNIQTYNYKIKANSEAHQWTLFNQNPINNNIYGKRDSDNLSEPRFFEDDQESTKDLLSTLFFFPNGPFTSKNYEGKPVTTSSINGLADGLYENNIYIKEENEKAVKYESNYVIETVDNGIITKQKPSPSVLDVDGSARFKDTRRLQITKVKYNFYTKDLVLIGDAGSPYSVNFNDGWEYDLQYQAKNAGYGSSGSSGSGASVGWAIMPKEGPLTKNTVSCEYSVISPYYFSAEDLETPNFLPMVAFKTNLPLFLDDSNYEFRILKREKLSVFSDSANVIKKTNFLPIKVDWDEVAGCGYYNIYQKDRDNNLTFLRSVSSGSGSFSHVVPDVKQKNVDLGVYNFGANGNNYYDIVVSGIKASVARSKNTISQEYGFEVGNSDFSETQINKLSEVTNYTPVNVSGPTYSQLLDFNNPESKNSAFEINENYNEYYFISNKANASLKNIPSSFESYVLNTGNASCLIDSTILNSNEYAKISNNGTITTAGYSSLPVSSFDLSDAFEESSVYLKSNTEVLNASVLPSKTLILVNDSDSNASIDITFGLTTTTIEANKTKKITFADDGSTKSVNVDKTYSNITAQDSEIYHPKAGFINFNHTTGSFSAADSYTNLPVFNFSTEPLNLNNLSLPADSFNYVSWNSSSASASQKQYFDDIKLYLKGTEKTEESVILIKDDIEIIISQFSLPNNSSRDYFFIKDESVSRAVNIKITNGSSTEILSRQRQDFKLTVNKTRYSTITYSIIYPSSSPFFEISNSSEQLVLLKGDSIQYIDLKSLDSGLVKGSFVYFINKNTSPVYFYRNKQEDIVYTLAQDQVARAMLITVGSTQVVRLEILNDTLSHFYFNVDNSFINSTINIVDLNFCATQISLPSPSSLNGKELFLICRNRFLPNKINKQSVNDVSSLISTTSNPTTSEVNEIGDIGSNSICLRAFGSVGDALTSIERTSFLQKNQIDLQDDTVSEEDYNYFYIRDENIDTFTIKDSYNRKFKYKGKIFLPAPDQSITIQSFDSSDGNSIFRVKDKNSIDFDYSPDEYLNGRLQITKPERNDAIIFSRSSELGSVTKNFPNALATDQILINFSFDAVTASVDASTLTLKKNRLVKNFTSNKIYPIYNDKEFFISSDNSFRSNTVVNGGTTLYYEIRPDRLSGEDIESIILPDSSATITFVIKNHCGRPYPIYKIDGTSVYTLAPKEQKIFTFTGSTYSVANDTTDLDNRSIVNEPTLITYQNQYLDLETAHPLAELWKFKNSNFDINIIQNAFIETDEETLIKLRAAEEDVDTVDYNIFDVYSTVPSSTDKMIYCYGRKGINVINLNGNYIVNDFYLFVKYNGTVIKKGQFYLTFGSSDVLSEGAHNLDIIDTNYTDLTKFFTSETAISNLPDVIFIPITKYASKFYLPNLEFKIKNSSGDLIEIKDLMVNKKILFVNLTKSDLSSSNSVYNYSDSVTTNLRDVNSLALFSVSGATWTKETANLPVVKKAFPTLKNIKGISGLSTTEIVGGKEFVYLPNFNRFNVSLESFEDRSFRDFYVFNSCKYRMYIGSNKSLLGTGALTKITRDSVNNLFTGSDLDQNGSSMFSVVTLNYAEGRAPENLTQTINQLYPKLKFGAKIKVVENVGNDSSTHFFDYDINSIAKEIIINNRDYGVLDLKDLLDYSASSKLFIYGSSQVNSTGNSFDNYNLKLINVNLLGVEKFYTYNNTPYYLNIYFENNQQQYLTVPPKRLVEITSSAMKFLGSYEKGKYYISKKQNDVNYLFKTDLKIFVDGIYDYLDFVGTSESSEQETNILISSLIKGEQYGSYEYFKDQFLLESVFDNFLTVDLPTLGSMSLSESTVLRNLIKPVFRITSAGHYLLNNNNNDITVNLPGSGEIFLINNCANDIFVNIIATSNLRIKAYRNTVLVLKSPIDGFSDAIKNGNIRYLKKSKSRDEFYCIFNPNTVISTQREITLKLGILRNDELLPILDDNQVEQKSYVKLLSKDGSSSKVNLTLRNYYNGKDIPTDSPSDVVGYEVGIGHETIYRFLFFDPSRSTYTLPGIQNGLKYQVSINKSFFDNINISADTGFTNTEEIPYVRYNGKIYEDGEEFEGTGVSTYEIKYPNFVRVYKVVEDIDRPFNKVEDKGEPNGVDPSITEEEEVQVDNLELFKAQIKQEYNLLAKSIIAWLPINESAFWLDSNYSNDLWTVDKINSSDTITIALSANETITFTKCEIKKTGLKVPIFKYEYSFFSALNPVRKMPNNKNLTIGLDGGLNDKQIDRIQKLLGEEQGAENILLPKSQMEIGGIYINNLFNPESPQQIIDSEISVNIKISKIKNMPDIKFDDFSKSSVIKIINRK